MIWSLAVYRLQIDQELSMPSDRRGWVFLISPKGYNLVAEGKAGEAGNALG